MPVLWPAYAAVECECYHGTVKCECYHGAGVCVWSVRAPPSRRAADVPVFEPPVRVPPSRCTDDVWFDAHHLDIEKM